MARARDRRRDEVSRQSPWLIESPAAQADVASVTDDQVVEHLDVQQFPRLNQLARHRHVVGRGYGSPTSAGALRRTASWSSAAIPGGRSGLECLRCYESTGRR